MTPETAMRRHVANYPADKADAAVARIQHCAGCQEYQGSKCVRYWRACQRRSVWLAILATRDCRHYRCREGYG